MKFRTHLGLTAMLLLLATPMLADMTFVSQAGLSLTSLTCDAGLGCTNISFAITPHDDWEPNGTPDALDGPSTAVWISDSLSGVGDANFQPHHAVLAGDATDQPIFSLTQSFHVGTGSSMTIGVWSDDTAGVYLDGGTLWAPILDQNTICSGAIIGCLPLDGGKSSISLSAGWHSLTFQPYQVGTGNTSTTNPFGLLYKVTVTGDVTVPDGGFTAMLLGGVLMGFATLRRRFKA